MANYVELPIYVPTSLSDLNANGLFVGHNTQYNFDVYITASVQAYYLMWQDNVPRGLIFTSIAGGYGYYRDLNNMPNIRGDPINYREGNNYTTGGAIPVANLNPIVTPFPSYSAAREFVRGFNPPSAQYPITYRLTNCSAPTAPVEAAVGDTVDVPFAFPDGYGFPNPATDVYVYNNGVLVPSSYANGVLTFTMPDPS